MIAYILLALSAIAKAIMDAAKINAFPESWMWWNELTSWRNKYQWNIPFAKTAMVWITDAWHFFQMLFLNLLFIGMWLFEGTWWQLLIVIVVYKVIFQGAYSLIKTIFK